MKCGCGHPTHATYMGTRTFWSTYGEPAVECPDTKKAYRCDPAEVPVRHDCSCIDPMCLAHDTARCHSSANTTVNGKHLCNECAGSIRHYEQQEKERQNR